MALAEARVAELEAESRQLLAARHAAELQAAAERDRLGSAKTAAELKAALAGALAKLAAVQAKLGKQQVRGVWVEDAASPFTLRVQR